MKKQYILPLLAVSAMAGLALTRVSDFDARLKAFTGTHKNAAGAPAGKTGAPGESNCTECHVGSTQNGNAINTLVLKDANGDVVTSYIPDSTYSVNFLINNPAPKKGFETVALKVNGATQAGTFTGTTGTSVISLGGKQYATHKSTSNMTTTGWNFKWKAPSTNVGDVRFYAAANVTNSSATESGDAIYLSQHTIPYNALASVEEQDQSMNFSAFFASVTNTVNLTFDSRITGNGFVNLVDLSGKSVYSNHFGDVKIGTNKEKVLLPAEIQNGIYIVHLFVNNQSTTHKILIQK